MHLIWIIRDLKEKKKQGKEKEYQGIWETKEKLKDRGLKEEAKNEIWFWALYLNLIEMIISIPN